MIAQKKSPNCCILWVLTAWLHTGRGTEKLFLPFLKKVILKDPSLCSNFISPEVPCETAFELSDRFNQQCLRWKTFFVKKRRFRKMCFWPKVRYSLKLVSWSFHQKIQRPLLCCCCVQFMSFQRKKELCFFDQKRSKTVLKNCPFSRKLHDFLNSLIW